MASVLRASVRSATSLIGLQLFSRLFTFAFNSALIRIVSPSIFGTASIQFDFLLSTILFLSREGVRNALLRSKRVDAATHNLSFLPFLAGLPLAAACTITFIHYAAPAARAQPCFDTSIAIYAAAALVELLTEPYHNSVMGGLQTSIRVRAEGLAVTVKSSITFFVLFCDLRIWHTHNLPLVSFAVGQLMYSCTLLVVYISSCGPSLLVPTGRSLNTELLKLSFTMTTQSIVKHFLTEGDKLLLSYFSPLQDQGGYALATNYGSLVARIIFQPIEEALRLFYAKTLSDVTRSKGLEKADNSSSLQQAAAVLTTVLSTQLSFSLILLAFGIPYLPFALKIALPPAYLSTSAPLVLGAWAWYIPVLAVNGGLEAFLASTASSKDLVKQSQWMAFFSLIYISVAVASYRFGVGDVALVYANIVNLTARIIYVINYITSFLNNRRPGILRWTEATPSKSLVTLIVLSVSIIYAQRQYLGITEDDFDLFGMAFLLHFGTGALLGLACVGTWWFSSGRSLKIPSRHEKQE